MTRNHLPFLAIAGALVTLCSDPVAAVCFYPGTSRSGYQVPLDVETRARQVIVIGRVASEKTIQDDKSDPDGITAFVYTFDVSRILKGRVADRIPLRAQNDSGGYRMTVGEQHILFLNKVGIYFEADACGNSSELAKAPQTVERVERLLNLKRVSR